MALLGPSSPFVRSFAFDEEGERVAGGSAVVAGVGESEAWVLEGERDAEELAWSPARARAFLAGEPLTLRFFTPAPQSNGEGRVYVCCWVSIDSE